MGYGWTRPASQAKERLASSVCGVGGISDVSRRPPLHGTVRRPQVEPWRRREDANPSREEST